MNKTKRLLTGAALLCGTLAAMAVPAKRDVQTITQSDGTTLRIMRVGDEHRHYMCTADGLLLTTGADGVMRYATVSADGSIQSTGIKAVDASMRSFTPAEATRLEDLSTLTAAAPMRKIPQTGMGLYDSTFPVKGSPKVLIILAEYSDVKFTVSNPATYFEEMLNKPGFSQYQGTGSCKDYFNDNSNLQFTPQFDVMGPVTLPQKRSYYGENNAYGDDINAEQMIVDAVKLLDPTVDFSIYDNDGNGVVDNVYLIYAGQGEASYGSENTVWPHSYELTSAGINCKADGVTIDRYACSNEWEDGRPDGIGTFIHEFSHVMGLPDLYHTYDSYAEYTPDRYSVMDYGPYNNDGRTPPAYSMYERNAMGWAEPEVITGAMDCELQHVLYSNKGYIIPTEKETEFFLLENRQLVGWDKYLPGHGMLIWHIDYNPTVWNNNAVNNTRTHQYVDLEEACGRYGLDDATQGGYPFPGTNGVTEFTDDTTPSMKSWSKKGQGLPITDIAEISGIIYFVVDGGNAPSIAVPEPYASEKIEKSPTHFVAAWDAVENALDYEVRVYAAGQGEPTTETCNMGSSKTLKLPSDWGTNCSDVYSSTTNYGEASPSLKMASTGAFLLSAEYDGDITSISYWRKGQNTDGSTLTISGLIEGKWQTIYTDTPANGDADVVDVEDIPAGVHQVRFEYTKVKGNLALDDVKITTGAGDELLADYRDLSTGGQTSLRVDKLRTGCNVYKYQVRAKGESRTTAYSTAVTVELPTGALTTIQSATADAEYFDITGRKVATPTQGSILIERRGTTVRKVVIR